MGVRRHGALQLNPLRSERVGPFVAAAVFAAAFIAIIVLALLNVSHSRSVDRKLCGISIENRMSTRAAFEAVRDAFLNNIPENEPPAERAESEARINAFIDRVLRPIPPLECVDNQPVPKEG